MIELDFINIDQNKVDKIKQKSIDRIYQNEEMRVFINENNLSREFVYEHLSDFIKVLEDRNKCKNCRGLNSCSKKGFYFDLILNKRKLTTEVKYLQCKLIQKRLNVKRKFIICDVDYSNFDFELKDCALYFKEDRKLALSSLAKIIKENLNNCVYLYGEEGIGKTFIMSIFAKHLVNKRSGHFVYVNCKNLIPSMIESSFKDKETFNEDLELLKTIDYLFLDNFGEEDKNDFSKESIIYEVLKERNEKSLPTYITSQYSPKDLFNAYRTPKSGNFKTKDIISFIESNSLIISIPTSGKIAQGIFKK
jgi:primosomal protein DnaI